MSEYTYEIFMNGRRLDVVTLEGIAVLKYESAKLLGEAMLFRISSNPDPVLGGTSIYNDNLGGWEDFFTPLPEE